MRKGKLTDKKKRFVKLITDEKNPETFGNGTQSALKSYDVKNENVASSIAYELLRKPEIIEAIEKKTVKRENIEHSLVSFTEKLENAVKDNVNLENVPLLKELREYHMASAKIGGLLIDKQQILSATVDLSDEQVKQALEELLNK